jgi:acyl-CoA thioester hydrolase
LKDGKVVAEGYEIRAWANLNGAKLKAIPIPREVRRAIKSTETLV